MAYDYDMIVIGGGAAGLTAASFSSYFGARTLLVEANRLGGDCTWTGCIPSKALIHAANVAHQVLTGDRVGIKAQDPLIDFEKVIARVHAVRNHVHDEADSPETLRRKGIEVAFGSASFLNDHTIAFSTDSGDRRVTSRYFIIATGAKPFVPPVDGIEKVSFLTNETLFESTRLPDHLLIIGAGPIGTEMAQAFHRLGSRVSVFEQEPEILSNDDPELTDMLRGHLTEQGIEYYLGASVRQVAETDSRVRLLCDRDGGSDWVEGDALLVATGRGPNVTSLNLAAAGVTVNQGITVDKRCRTSRKHIYAVGDVTGGPQFTHASEHMAKIAAMNAILKIPARKESNFPWVTYCDPELAHVGATEHELATAGTTFKTCRLPFSKIDRAATDDQTVGLIRVFAKPRSGKILGASILGSRAGDLIGEYALAIKHGLSMRQISGTIHPYPTYGLGIRQSADQWLVDRDSMRTRRLVKRLFGYSGALAT